jgi:hypothetical protein
LWKIFRSWDSVEADEGLAEEVQDDVAAVVMDEGAGSGWEDSATADEVNEFSTIQLSLGQVY